MELKSRIRQNSKAIIVHPLYTHTIHEPPTELNEISSWMKLPNEILIHSIASHLDAKDLCILAMTSKELHYLAYNELVWENLCRKQFCIPVDRPLPPSATWRDVYRFNHEAMQYILKLDQTNQENMMMWPMRRPTGPILIQGTFS